MDGVPLTRQVHYLHKEPGTQYVLDHYCDYPMDKLSPICCENSVEEGESISFYGVEQGSDDDSKKKETLFLPNNEPMTYKTYRKVYGLDKMPHSEIWQVTFTLVDLSDPSIVNEAISRLKEGTLYHNTPGEGEYIEGLYATFNLRYTVEEAMDEAHKERRRYMEESAKKGFPSAKVEIE